MARKGVSASIRDRILIANRHACCVCQRTDVVIHHIDENASNNLAENLAVLCLHHHDMAHMKIGLSSKLSRNEIEQFKEEWEWKCTNDVLALARARINVYVALYKNPPRIRQLFSQLSEIARTRAYYIIGKQILQEEPTKAEEFQYQWQSLPRVDDSTYALLLSMVKGELWPSCVPRVKGHPEDPDYPDDLSPPNGMIAFHQYDLYCQILVRALLLSWEVVAFEDLLKLGKDIDLSAFSGSLVIFHEHVRGKGVKAPRYWKTNPLGELKFQRTQNGVKFRCIMAIRTMYVFSDTAQIELSRGHVCGIGILQGCEKQKDKNGKEEIHIRLIPLLLGLGKPQLHWGVSNNLD